MDGRQSNSWVILEKTITIPKNKKDILLEHAKNQFPNESSALLFGKRDDGSFLVSEIFLTQNQKSSPIEFTIANEDLINAYQEAERLGLDVIGIFHSHPHSAAIPSATDRKYMETNPVVWVIFSNKDDIMNAYILESDIVKVSLNIS